MSRELFFLRSSEQKIVTSMFKYAHPNKEDEILKYTEFYGLTPKDLGLYALVDNKIAGAIWSRRFDNAKVPTLSVAILPEFKGSGIGAFMLEQFLQEAGALYEEIVIDISDKQGALAFYEKFGFQKENKTFLLRKKLIKREVIRPSDGYDPTRWIE